MRHTRLRIMVTIAAVAAWLFMMTTTAEAATGLALHGSGYVSNNAQASDPYYGFECGGFWHRITPCIDVEGAYNYLQVVAGEVECMLYADVSAFWVISSSKHSFPTYSTSVYQCKSSIGPAATSSVYHAFDRNIAYNQKICAVMHTYLGAGRWRVWKPVCETIVGPAPY